jgi:hypothetical protein
MSVICFGYTEKNRHTNSSELVCLGEKSDLSCRVGRGGFGQQAGSVDSAAQWIHHGHAAIRFPTHGNTGFHLDPFRTARLVSKRSVVPGRAPRVLRSIASRLLRLSDPSSSARCLFDPRCSCLCRRPSSHDRFPGRPCSPTHHFPSGLLNSTTVPTGRQSQFQAVALIGGGLRWLAALDTQGHF